MKRLSAARPGRAVAAVLAVIAVLLAVAKASTATNEATRVTRHLEYVVDDGSISVYDIDRQHRLVQHIALPDVRGIRGVGAAPSSRTLYISYGGDGGQGTGRPVP